MSDPSACRRTHTKVVHDDAGFLRCSLKKGGLEKEATWVISSRDVPRFGDRSYRRRAGVDHGSNEQNQRPRSMRSEGPEG